MLSYCFKCGEEIDRKKKSSSAKTSKVNLKNFIKMCSVQCVINQDLSKNKKLVGY